MVTTSCLTELAGPEHSFIVEAGSQAGAQILDRLPVRAPEIPARRRGQASEVQAAADEMGRAMATSDLRELLADSLPGRPLGRRGLPVPDLRELHDGLPNLLLYHGRGQHRSER